MIKKQTINKVVHKIALYTAILRSFLMDFCYIWAFLFILTTPDYENVRFLKNLAFILYIFFHISSIIIIKKLNFNKNSCIFILFFVQFLELTVPLFIDIMNYYKDILSITTEYIKSIKGHYIFSIPSIIIMICCIILFFVKDKNSKAN